MQVRQHFEDWHYWHEQWEERAAIIEYDTPRIPTQEAEKKAFRQIKEQYTTHYKLPYYGGKNVSHYQILQTEGRRVKLVNEIKKIIKG